MSYISGMDDKRYITAQELLDDSFQMGIRIYQSGFRPSFIIGIWRGGTPVGIAIQEMLDYLGIQTDHIAIRTSSYYGIEEKNKIVRVHGIGYVVNRADHDNGLLVVDDVFDSGRSVKAVLEKLKNEMRRNLPKDIRIATPWFKPKKNKTDIVPDYYLHETDRWLVFPHELDGLTKEEILNAKPGMKKILKGLI